jgi:capsular exopolysaccharide synthesis family protein
MKQNDFSNFSEERNKVIRHLEIILRQKWTILFTLLVTIVIVYFYTKSQPYIYQSTVTIIVEQEKISSGAGIEDYTGGASRNLENEIAVLQSNSLLLEVAKKLADRFYIDTTNQKEDTLLVVSGAMNAVGSNDVYNIDVLDYIANSVIVRSSITSGKLNDILRIAVSSQNPREAAITANIYAETYYELDLVRSRSNASDIRVFLETQRDQIEAELRKSEAALQEYLEKENVSELSSQSEQLITRINSLEIELEENQIEYDKTVLLLENYKTELEKIIPLMTEKIVNADDRYIQRLQEEIAKYESERDISKIVSRSEANNPDYIRQFEKLDQTIDSLRSLLSARTKEYINNALPNISFEDNSKELNQNLVARYTGEIQRLQLKKSSLSLSRDAIKSHLDRYDKQFAKLPGQNTVVARLRLDKEKNEKQYLALEEKFREAKIAELSTFGRVQIIDKAKINYSSISPRILANLVIGIILGLLFGVSIAYLLNFMFHYVRSPEDVESLGFRLISTIPRLQSSPAEGNLLESGEDNSGSKLLSAKSSYSIAMESYQRLQLYLSYSLLDKDIKTLVVTSSGPGEGKSATASNLAITLANSGKKVLLIDTDMRKPSVHKYFDVSPKPSLPHYLYGKCTLEEVIKTGHIKGLNFITSIEFSDNPALVLTSKKMKDFIAKVSEMYDFIIFDTPPVNAVTDAIHLAKLVDEVILIARADKTNVEELNRANKLFEQFNITIGGVVLNDYDNSKLTSYYGQYYGFYSSEASDKKPGKHKKGDIKNKNIRTRKLLRPDKFNRFPDDEILADYDEKND